MPSQNAGDMSYEIGSWTPTVTGASTTGTTVYNQQVGYYVRVGRLIFCQGYVDIASASGTGNFQLSGLPYSTSSGTNQICAIASLNGHMAYVASTTMMSLFTGISAANSAIEFCASNVGFANGQIANTASQYYFSILYMSAS